MLSAATLDPESDAGTTSQGKAKRGRRQLWRIRGTVERRAEIYLWHTTNTTAVHAEKLAAETINQRDSRCFFGEAENAFQTR